MVSSTVTCWASPFVILGVSDLFCHFYSIFDGKILLANNVDSDQMPHNVASDLGLHCLSLTLLVIYMFPGKHRLKTNILINLELAIIHFM